MTLASDFGLFFFVSSIALFFVSFFGLAFVLLFVSLFRAALSL